MLCWTCEFPAVVHNIENGQPNQRTIEMPHSGGPAYVITESSVPGKYAWLPWWSPALAEWVQTKYGSLRPLKTLLYLLIKLHQKFQVPCQDHCQTHYSISRLLIVRILIQSCEQISQSKTYTNIYSVPPFPLRWECSMSTTLTPRKPYQRLIYLC